jgi:AAA+ ATPase superfamily predicted ATPase
MFTTNVPVARDAFYDRAAELERLGAVADALARGATKWLAILGSRKIGKSSLLLEASRRYQSARVHFALFDVTEHAPVSEEVFRRYALRVLDAVWAPEVGGSLEVLADDQSAFAASVASASGFAHLEPGMRTFLLDLPRREMSPATIRMALELPAALASITGGSLVVAIDEFQDLAELSRRGVDAFTVMRSVWQRHTAVAYVISGSGRSMLRNLVSSKSSPFFQHFDVVELGSLPEADALRLLVGASPRGRQIPKSIARRIVEVVGRHPFYLQLVGDALTRTDPPYDEDALKSVMQDLLFSRTGRLALYFEAEVARLVGHSKYLAAVLDALAEGPKRLGEVAATIGAQPGHASGYIDRLGDVVVKRQDGRYALDDATLGLWLRWRRPVPSALPMSILGSQAEADVAAHLARLGFELVYQSRASRGAFDLLATRGPHQLGVQAKRGDLPLRFTRTEWNRMSADAARLGWVWAVAAVSNNEVRLLDPARAHMGRQIRVGVDAVIANVLAWLDRRAPR